jgi:hypothetical protein
VRRVVAGVLALCLAAPVARGDELAEAKASFRRGVELYRERRWKEAMEEFQAAYRAKPHGALHFNVAQCRERLDDWPGAIRSYHDYLRELPGAADKEAVGAAVKRLEEKLASVGVQVLLLDSTPPGARVVLEGLERGVTPLHVVLQPGAYALALALDGHAPWTRKVEMGATATVAVEAALTAAPAGKRPAAAADLAARPAAEDPGPARPPVPAPSRPRRYLPAWIAGGAAVAAAVAAVAYGASARSDERAIDRLARPDGAAASALARSASSKRRTADVLYGVAGGAAVTGAALLVLEWRF